MPNWFHRAFDEFERPLLRYVTSLVSDFDSSQDIVQEAFVKMHRQGDPAPGKSAGPWLFRVCRNAALDHLRRGSRVVCLESVPEPSETLPEAPPDAEDLEWLRSAIEALPVNQREVVRLKFDHQCRYKEIAQLTGLTVTNVGFLLSTALRRLREMRAAASSSSNPKTLRQSL